MWVHGQFGLKKKENTFFAFHVSQSVNRRMQQSEIYQNVVIHILI